jgi:hypothetical protein
MVNMWVKTARCEVSKFSEHSVTSHSLGGKKNGTAAKNVPPGQRTAKNTKKVASPWLLDTRGV